MLKQATKAPSKAAPIAVDMPQILPQLLPMLDACMFTVTACLRGTAVHTLIDSGPSTSFMLERIADNLKLQITNYSQWSGKQKMSTAMNGLFPMPTSATSCVVVLCGKKCQHAFFVNMASEDPFVTLGVNFLCSCGYVLGFKQRRFSYERSSTTLSATHRLGPSVRDSLLGPIDGTRLTYEEARKGSVPFAIVQLHQRKF